MVTRVPIQILFVYFHRLHKVPFITLHYTTLISVSLNHTSDFSCTSHIHSILSLVFLAAFSQHTWRCSIHFGVFWSSHSDIDVLHTIFVFYAYLMGYCYKSLWAFCSTLYVSPAVFRFSVLVRLVPCVFRLFLHTLTTRVSHRSVRIWVCRGLLFSAINFLSSCFSCISQTFFLLEGYMTPGIFAFDWGCIYGI